MAVSWEAIDPDEFEELCFHLLETMGFTSLEWHGNKGGDRGRDLVGKGMIQIMPGKSQVTNLVAQCKRYTKEALRKYELDDMIVDAKEHKPDLFLVITTATLSSQTWDWVRAQEGQHGFRVEVIDAPALETLLRERVDKLGAYLPESLRRELVVTDQVSSGYKSRLEDMFVQHGPITKQSLKEKMFGTTEVMQNITVQGPVYGQSVILRPGSTVEGDVYARRDLKIGRGSKVSGSVVSPGEIELVECELGNVCGSQITMKNPITIHGRLVTDRDLSVPPDSKIASIWSSGKKLEVGERSEIGSVSCEGVTILGDGARVTTQLKSTDVRLRPGCQVGWISSKGDLSSLEGTSVENLSTDGSVKADARVKMKRLYAAGDVELLSGGLVEELRCRNLTASSGLMIERLRATGNVRVGGEGGSYLGKFLSAGGDVILPDRAEVEVLSVRGDVVLGVGCKIRYLVARSLKAMDKLDGGSLRCHGSVDLGANCRVGSLQAGRGIKFKEGFCSESWTIFSEKGAIQGRGAAKLGDVEVPSSGILKFKEGTLLTALLNEEQLNLIEGPQETRH